MPNSFIAYAENEITLTKREESFVETLGFIDEISDNYASRKTYAKAVLKAGGKLQNEDEVSDERLGEMAKANKVLGVFDDGGKVAQKMSNSVKLTRDSQALIRPYIQYDFLLFTKTTFLEYTVSRGKLVLNRGLMNNIYIGDDMAYTSINGQPRTVFLIK